MVAISVLRKIVENGWTIANRRNIIFLQILAVLLPRGHNIFPHLTEKLLKKQRGMNMSNFITSVERTGEIIRKLNFPVWKLELAAAGEMTDLQNNKQTFSFSCKKKIGLLCIVAIMLILVLMCAKAARR